MKALIPALIVVPAVLAGCGSCMPDFSDDEGEPYEPYPEPRNEDPPRTNREPQITSIEIPDWPPTGRDGLVSVQVNDDCCLSEVAFTFAGRVSVRVAGTSAAATVRGGDLGEGLGTLFIDVFDGDGAWSSRMVENMLVDLTPPEAGIGETVLRAADGEIEVWIGDAWVLGSVRLGFGGVVATHTLPAWYPETLGTDWDHSLESFPASDFPAGKGTATVVVTDAAGNEANFEFGLVIDGAPPVVEIVEPVEGTVVYGPFRIAVDANDDLGTAEVKIFAGGAQVATATGPNATVDLDSNDFPWGNLEIGAVAVDQAGNETAAAPVHVVVE